MRNIINPLLVLFAKMQKFKIAHRSIKPENILRGFDNEIKISDFGCANPMM
jgi:serine/threonine protein kinase